MKKFLSCMVLMMLAMSVSAMAQMKAASPPEQDIGYEQVATLSLDGMTVAAFDSQLNIVDWQTHVMPNMEVGNASAQAADAYSIATTNGEVSMALVCFRWPTTNSQMNNATLRNNISASAGLTYSFRPSRADCS